MHLWTQVVGKYRLAHTPWVNHSWHATLYVTPRGLTTGPVHDNANHVTVQFDFHDHVLVVEALGGRRETFELTPMSVAAFYEKVGAVIRAVGGTPDIHHFPNELPDAVPFSEDRTERPYDAGAVERFHRALVRIDAVMNRFRTGFLGKVSPVHLFWGSFDLAVTRFSGRLAPLHPGGFPNLPDIVTQEAYSHEVSSAGFWPGGGGGDQAMFYSYAYPTPDGMSDRLVEPAAAYWDSALGEFLLPYDAVRTAADPDATLMTFLQSTYEAAADAAVWDRRALECAVGRPRVPRAIHAPVATG